MMNSLALLIVMMSVISLTSSFLIRRFPTVGRLSSESSGRFGSLDAMRGLLACSVLVSHAYIARRFFMGEPWQTPDHNVYHFLGGGAVAMFFMITGLLFWGKVLDNRLGGWGFLRSRVRRIMPLYIFSALIVVAACLIQTGLVLRVPVAEFALSVAMWAGGGLLGKPSINGYPTLMVNADVTWTLQFEWIYYLLLVPLAYFAKPARFAVLLAGYVCIAAGLRIFEQFLAMYWILIGLPFFGGMLTAYIVRGRKHIVHPNSGWVSVLIFANITAVALLYDDQFGVWLNLALIPAFVALALGNDLFGMLKLRPLRWLGHISFSIYLLHGIVLLVTLTALNKRWPIAGWTDGTYLAVCAAIGVLAVLISSLTYLFIERRFSVDQLPAIKRPAFEAA